MANLLDLLREWYLEGCVESELLEEKYAELSELKNPCKYVLTGDGEVNLTDVDFSKPAIWIFGNEARGFKNGEIGATTVSIPMSGNAESLNLSAAAAIVMHEISRDRSSARRGHGAAQGLCRRRRRLEARKGAALRIQGDRGGGGGRRIRGRCRCPWCCETRVRSSLCSSASSLSTRPAEAQASCLADRRGRGRDEREPDERVGDRCVLGSGHASRPVVRVLRLVAGRDDHVLDRPERLEPGLLRGAPEADGPLGVGERSDVREGDAELHVRSPGGECPARLLAGRLPKT